MEALKRYLTRKKLTQVEFGKRFGISAVNMSRYLTGNRAAPPHLLVRIANYTGIPLGKLLRDRKADGRARA
jgi:transcriptional regulator with XRE-family HTH domain